MWFPAHSFDFSGVSPGCSRTFRDKYSGFLSATCHFCNPANCTWCTVPQIIVNCRMPAGHMLVDYLAIDFEVSHPTEEILLWGKIWHSSRPKTVNFMTFQNINTLNCISLVRFLRSLQSFWAMLWPLSIFNLGIPSADSKIMGFNLRVHFPKFFSVHTGKTMLNP